MTNTAIRANYDRKTKSYVAEVVANADPLMAHDGYMVYTDGNEERVLESVRTRRMLGHWKDEKVKVVITHLENVLAARQERHDAEYREFMRKADAYEADQKARAAQWNG